MSGPALRILGIDPGLRITGFGIIEKNGASLAYVASGCIKSGKADLPGRLKTILENLREVIDEHRPQQIALEKVFVNVNPASTLALGQPRAAGLDAAARDVGEGRAVFFDDTEPGDAQTRIDAEYPQGWA